MAIVVKQEEVYKRDNTKLVRISLRVTVLGIVRDFRMLKDVDETALAALVTADSQFGNRVKVSSKKAQLFL